MVDLGATQQRCEKAVKLYDKRKLTRLRASDTFNRAVRMELEAKEVMEEQRDILMSNANAITQGRT